MKRMFLAIGIAVLIAGCGSQTQADTGKEWLANIQAAVKRNDSEAIWKMFSKGAQKNLIDMAKGIKENIPSREGLKKAFEIDADPKTISETDLAKLLIAGKNGGAREMENFVYVSEKKKGDQIEVIFKSGDKEDHIYLVREEGTLKMAPAEE